MKREENLFVMETLKVPAILQSLEPVINYALTAAGEAGFSQQERWRVQLAVDELATNIIEHGYKKAGLSGELLISAEYNEEQIVIYLEDTGQGHDPRSTPPPNLNVPVEERPLGGLGIYLALWALDKFDYEQQGDRNRSTLIVQKTCPSRERKTR